MHRAYALLTVKSLDADKRQITGVASTPEPDRMGDVVEPLGVAFKNPLPLLLFHDAQQPVGFATFKKPTKNGIEFSASLPAIDEPGTLKDRIDTAWQSLKAGLISGVSIGFRAIETSFIEATGGIRFLETEVVELSLVTIPANAQATITSIKSLDQAASGHHSSGVSDPLPVVRSTARGRPMAQTINEQIASFENTRASKVAEMNAVMKAASDKGETLDKEQTEKYDGLALEVKAIDDHLPRLRDLEKTNVVAATAVARVVDIKTAGDVRGGTPVVTVGKHNLPKGTAMTRFVIAKIIGKNSNADAIAYAESRKDWMEQTPEVVLALKAAVNPGTIAEPAWAAPLAVTRPMQDEFLELLRPATIIGKIPGLRRVPFNISMPVQTGGGTYGWVGEGAPKPVGQLALTSATLGIAKAAGIIVISEELAKISSPSAESVVRADMIAGSAQFLDTQFIDPTVAAVTNVSPASITNGAVSVGSAGTSAADFETDFKGLIGSLISANQKVTGLTMIMSETNALALSMARTTNGEMYFPNLTMAGGTINGIPVVTSQAAGITVAVVVPNEILFADDGGVNIDVSREASLEMNTAPTSPVAAGTILVSLWQQNLIGLRAERFINWKRARLSAVRYTNQTYA